MKEGDRKWCEEIMAGEELSENLQEAVLALIALELDRMNRTLEGIRSALEIRNEQA